MSTQVWDVPCFVCGFKLGSNKARCGQDEGKRKVKNPPCVWAHSDSNIVSKCFRLAEQKAAEEQAREAQVNEVKERIRNGSFIPSYEEPVHAVDQAPGVRDEFSLTPSPTPPTPAPEKRKGGKAIVGKGDEQRKKSAKYANKEAPPSSAPDAAASSAATNDNNKGAPPPPVSASTNERDNNNSDIDKTRTKWNCMTRTMLWRCIQKFDPFSSPDKAKLWDRIAKEMYESTRTLGCTADGDFRVYSCGKTINVFYNRCRTARKEADDGESHSGGAGREDVDRSVKEERAQLYACIELERSAKEHVEQKREDKKAFDTLRNGEVNDMVINLAVSNETVRIKAVKVLASKLRAAKMRKIAWESANKGGKYTYTDADLRDFEQWKTVQQADPSLPDDPADGATSDATIAPAPRGGALAACITTLLERQAASAAQLQPASPKEFASAFWNARSEHVDKMRLSLKDKLARVDADVADGSITAQEAEGFKEQIKKDHYKF
jgi:hypothetical protein